MEVGVTTVKSVATEYGPLASGVGSETSRTDPHAKAPKDNKPARARAGNNLNDLVNLPS